MRFRYTLLAVGFALIASTASTQTPQEIKKDPQSSVEPKSAPGEGQKFLTKFVGTWSVEKRFHPKEGEPVKSSGTCKQEMTHGGRFLTSEFTFEGASGKSTGTGLIGYETVSGQFTSVWYDSRTTRMSFRRSKEKFDGKQIVLYASALDGAEARQSKTVTKLEDDGKRIVHQQFVSAGEGKERVMMELILTKQPEKKAE